MSASLFKVVPVAQIWTPILPADSLLYIEQLANGGLLQQYVQQLQLCDEALAVKGMSFSFPTATPYPAKPQM